LDGIFDVVFFATLIIVLAVLAEIITSAIITPAIILNSSAR
jgi:hypothetical protein